MKECKEVLDWIKKSKQKFELKKTRKNKCVKCNVWCRQHPFHILYLFIYISRRNWLAQSTFTACEKYQILTNTLMNIIIIIRRIYYSYLNDRATMIVLLLCSNTYYCYKIAEWKVKPKKPLNTAYGIRLMERDTNINAIYCVNAYTHTHSIYQNSYEAYTEYAVLRIYILPSEYREREEY